MALLCVFQIFSLEVNLLLLETHGAKLEIMPGLFVADVVIGHAGDLIFFLTWVCSPPACLRLLLGRTQWACTGFVLQKT